MKWLSYSGLKVNEGKTEMCLFLRNDCSPITLTINGSEIKSTPLIKVPGVYFDSKLNWQKHIEMAISKSCKALQVIKLIKKHFSKKELMTLVTSKYYSILFYNSSIWLIPGLTCQSKLAILNASAALLKFCCAQYHNLMSYERLHEITGRPLPNAICKCNQALLLHKTYNDQKFLSDGLVINFNQNFNNRHIKVKFYDSSRFHKVKTFWQQAHCNIQ